MRFRPLTLLLPLACLACVPNGKTPSTPAAVAPETTATAADENATLTGYRWTLSSATDAQGQRIDALFPGDTRGLSMGFNNDQADVSGGCNRMSGSYRRDAQGNLTIAPMRSTRKACVPALMQADAAVAALLSTPQQLRIEDNMPPRLQLQSVSGEHSTWIGEATAQTRYGGPGETVFFETAPAKVSCNHPLIPDYRCLQVREIRYDDSGIKHSPPGEWQLLYEDIEGYTFHEGERNILRLKKFKRDPAPADASSIVYVLDMVVESEVVPTADKAK